MSVTSGLVLAGSGFLLAVLWMDLIFDTQCARHRNRGEQLPEPVLSSISAYYHRATTTSQPMGRLIAVVMVVLLGAPSPPPHAARAPAGCRPPPACWWRARLRCPAPCPTRCGWAAATATRQNRAAWPAPSCATTSSASPRSSCCSRSAGPPGPIGVVGPWAEHPGLAGCGRTKPEHVPVAHRPPGAGHAHCPLRRARHRVPDLRLHPLPRRRRRRQQGRRLRGARSGRIHPEQLEIECAWIDDNIGDHPYGVDIVIPNKYEGMDTNMSGDELADMLKKMVPQQHLDFAKKLLADHGVPTSDADSHALQLLGWTEATATPQVEVALRHPKVTLIANALGTRPST